MQAAMVGFPGMPNVLGGKTETVRCVIEWRDDGETHTLEALMLHCERKGAKPMDVVAMMTACCSHEDLQYLIKEGLTDEVYASLRVQAEKLETSKEFSGFLANSAWRGKKDSKAVKNCVASWDALSHYCNVDDIVCFKLLPEGLSPEERAEHVKLQKREHVITREMLEIQMATQAEIEAQRQKDQRETEAARAAHRKRQEELAAEAEADRAVKHQESMANQDEVKKMVAAMLPEIKAAIQAEGSAIKKKVEETARKTARKGRRPRAVVSICGNSSSSDEDSASDGEETTPPPVAAAKSPNAEERAWPESKGVLPPPQRLFEEGGSPTTGEAEAAGASLDDTTVEAQSPGFAERGTEAADATLDDDETVTQAPPREAEALDDKFVADAPPQGTARAVGGATRSTRENLLQEVIACAQGRINCPREWGVKRDLEKPRDPNNRDKIEMNPPHWLPWIALQKGIDFGVRGEGLRRDL